MKHCLATLSLLSASLAVSSASFAEPTKARQVRYNDLDLSTANGVNVLDRRIERAVNEVCLDPTGPSPAAIVNSTCAAQARSDARRQLKVAIEQRRFGRSAAAAGYLQITARTADRR